jgi:hypothetical protein
MQDTGSGGVIAARSNVMVSPDPEFPDFSVFAKLAVLFVFCHFRIIL